ncbi:Bromodomain-containing protein, partial [Dothidotthia symphoricarpi CBS 119687]
LHFHGPMAVMTSPAFDKSPLDVKASAFAPTDAMALDTEANGIHDVLFDEPGTNTNPTEDAAQDPVDDSAQLKSTTNGNHVPSDTSASAIESNTNNGPTTNVSSGIDGIAQFLPDAMQDTNSSFGDSEDIGTTSLTHAAEAPTSDVRDDVEVKAEQSAEVPAASEGIEQVSEDQVDSKDDLFGDAMDISADMTEDTKPPSSSAAPPTNSMTELTIQTQLGNVPAPLDSAKSPKNMDHAMEDAPMSGKVRRREEDEDDVPEAKRTKTEDDMNGQIDFKVPDVPSQPEQPSANANANGVPRGVAVPISHEPSGLQHAVDYEHWPTATMTEAQNRFLLERIRNTKKIKVSLAFKDPVDPIALNIPTYTTIVTKPMDLSTMEGKLKEKRYTHVREFMSDLDQMIENSELFNNKQHPVTQAGYNLRAYFLKGMGKMPRGSVEEPPKPVKVRKPSSSSAPKARRDSRAPPVTVKSPTIPTPAVASPQAAWPLGQDGIPVIRRDSSSANDRPKREIHRPSKDLPYANAKPRKKKFQQELKFCESVMAELTKPKYAAVTYPFMVPVDPVALNIPSYLKIIKKPMDFGTIDKNLKNGVYQSAKDFHNDAQLVFQNCYKFNPEGDVVNKMGKELESLFEELWKEKADWLAQHAPAPEQSPGELYSDEDDEEEEEEEDDDPAQAQFLAIQQQIAALNETAQQLLKQQTGKRASPKVQSKKKSKVVAPPPKKKAPLSVPPPVNARSNKQKTRPKAPAPLTFAQKQEISEGISTLGDADMRRAVQIIRNGCPHLASVNDDEMELDMDEINDETLRELFRFIKSIRGPRAGAAADDDFEPPRPTHKQTTTTTTSRPKKNKPMGKTEQEENMRKIQEKLNSFQGGASGSSQSPPAQDDSDDDDSSASESEEE